MAKLPLSHPNTPSLNSHSRWHTQEGKRFISSRTYPVVATTNLRLRAFTLRDIPRLLAIAEARGMGDTAICLPEKLTGQYANQWITSHSVSWESRCEVHWAVTLLANNQLVGYLGLTDLDAEDSRVTVGFWLDRIVSWKNYVTEAAQAALAFAFSDLGMNSVHAFQFAEDSLAPEILTATGLRRGELLKEYARHFGQLEDVIPWCAMRSEWLESLLGS